MTKFGPASRIMGAVSKARKKRMTTASRMGRKERYKRLRAAGREIDRQKLLLQGPPSTNPAEDPWGHFWYWEAVHVNELASAEECEKLLDSIPRLIAAFYEHSQRFGIRSGIDEGMNEKSFMIVALQKKYVEAVDFCLSPEGYERLYLSRDYGDFQKSVEAQAGRRQRTAFREMRSSFQVPASASGRQGKRWTRRR
jgi:hypothetical protein